MKSTLTRLIAAFAFLTQVSAWANNLTPGGQTNTGTAVNQITAVQPTGRNLIGSASQATVNTWNQVGGVGLSCNAAQNANQWDGGWLPCLLVGSSTTQYIYQDIVIAPGATASYTLSGQFSISQALAGMSQPPVTSARMDIIYSNGVTRTDSIVFNPTTGQLISSSGFSAVQVQLFNSVIVSSTTGANTPIPVLYIAATSPNITTATTLVQIRLYPNNAAITGTAPRMVFGGVQYELGATATAFMPTSFDNSPARVLGTIPRNAVPFYQPTLPAPVTSVTMDPFTDNATLVTFNAGGNTYFLDDGTARKLPINGQNVTVVNNNTGQTTIRALGTAKIYGPGISSAGVTTLTFPTGGGTTYPGAAVTFVYDGINTAWRVTSGNLAAINPGSGGTGCVPAGSAGQLLTDSGAGGCTSNTTGTGVITAAGNNTNVAGGLTVPAAALTANQLVTGGGSGTGPATLGTLGTTTTLLHGNGAGAPTFRAVDLTAEVTGDLPYANLTPSGAASKLLGRGSASGAGDWQEITISTGLTMTGTTLTASGGSGCTTSGSAGQALVDNGSGGCTSTATITTGAAADIVLTPSTGLATVAALTGQNAQLAVSNSFAGTSLVSISNSANTDAWTRYGTDGAGTPDFWSVGIDASAGNAFVISENSTLGTNNALSFATSTRAATFGLTVTANSFIPNSGSAPTNGLYLVGANNPGISASSTKVLDCLSTGCTITGTATITGAATAARFIPSGSTVATNGLYLPAANNPAISANSTKVFDCTSTGCNNTGAFASTGNITAPNLVGSGTLTNGGICRYNSTGPVIDCAVVPAAGQVLNNATYTATPTLGASGTVGTLALGNATSGTVTLSTVSGALGSTTLTLPVAVGTGRASQVIANGTSALGTGAITSATCATVVTTTATGTATTDVVNWGFNGDPTGVTGYAASASGMLTIVAYPSANNVNYKVCNNTAGSITPGAITLNWVVVR